MAENANCDFSSVENSVLQDSSNTENGVFRITENAQTNINNIKNNNSLNTSMKIPDNGTGIFMILKDGSFYEAAPDKVAMWQRAYPRLDVECELYQMAAWCVSNPAKRKTRTGIEKFINGWLNRRGLNTQNRRRRPRAMDQTSHTTQSHLKNTCKVCKGLGYIIEHKIVSEYDQNTPVEFATPCPACRGNQSDHRTGIPQMFQRQTWGNLILQDMEAEPETLNKSFPVFGKIMISGKNP